MDFDVTLVEESRSFLQTVSQLSPATAVPTCPGWTVDALVWHLTEVQMFWGLIVEHELAEADVAERMKAGRPDTYDGLLALFEQQSARLSTALTDRADGVPVWTWSDDRTVGFVRRRQAHEALIHRVDAEAAAARAPGSIDAELAADGIDEVLRIMAGGIPEWATFDPEGVEIRITATDVDRTWGAAFGRMRGASPDSGKIYDTPALTVGVDAVSPITAIAGTAADLDLWLWGRGPDDGLTIEGAESAVHRLRAVMAESTQ